MEPNRSIENQEQATGAHDTVLAKEDGAENSRPARVVWLTVALRALLLLRVVHMVMRGCFS
jgi:hypothetical protein